MAEKTKNDAVKEITDKLEQGLKELFDSEKFKAYLNTMSKFHNYSFNNTLLIAMQKPDATLVAGFQSWQKNFERHVNKGEKGIKIMAPSPYKKKQEMEVIDPKTQRPVLGDDGKPKTEEVEITIPAFRPVTVFDVSQTTGKEIPTLGADELKFSVEGFEDFMKAMERVAPVPIEYMDISSGAKGYFSPSEQKIAIQKDMGESQTVKTAVHETAHSLLHDKDNVRVEGIEAGDKKTRSTKEVEAESVAYTVCQHFGIDTSDY
ncbi:MAG: ArdC-like ssDNA-binding domain-containing protein, partial [Lachnospiraceae bacterium]|nr:ArdC-like ssDNA-binding domain-containing protein [Lachnospiraceae bacterium]